MSASRQVALVDRLRCRPSETEWLEFKRRRCAPDQLGQYLSALANSACLVDQPRGYLVLGIEDGTREVAGTDFDLTQLRGRETRTCFLGSGRDSIPIRDSMFTLWITPRAASSSSRWLRPRISL